MYNYGTDAVVTRMLVKGGVCGNEKVRIQKVAI